MKKEEIKALFDQFESARQIVEGVECWSARDMQVIFNYSEWRNFLKVVDKAKESCKNSEIELQDHFVDVNKMVDLGSGGKRGLDDIALTRYACYLVAQNGDSSKSEIAFAQTYFAVQTRKQEIIEKRLKDVDRVMAREKLSKSEKKLSGIVYQRGVDDKGFALIRSKGDQALFGGFSTNDMKRKLGVPDSRALADFLPALTIKAKDFATEATSHNVIEKDLRGEEAISKEHVNSNHIIRNAMIQLGAKPELLPAAEDSKKVQRRLESDEKKVIKEGKKKRLKRRK